MRTLAFLFSGIFIAGLEPFVPVGSAVFAFSAAVGVRRRDWRGMAAVFLAGVGRDVALVLPLGESAFAAVVIFSVCGIIVGRINRPAAVAAAVGGGGALGVALAAASARPSVAAAATAAWTVLLFGGMSWIRGRSDRIRLRG